MDLTSFAGRLRHAVSLSGAAAREIDRLAGLPSGRLGMLFARAKSDADASMEFENGAAYLEVLGLDARWLARGQGPAPTPEAVQAAVARARAAREASPAEPGAQGAA